MKESFKNVTFRFVITFKFPSTFTRDCFSRRKSRSMRQPHHYCFCYRDPSTLTEWGTSLKRRTIGGRRAHEAPLSRSHLCCMWRHIQWKTLWDPGLQWMFWFLQKECQKEANLQVCILCRILLKI